MRVVLAVAITLLLSGCFGSGPSQKELEADLAVAIHDFRTAVLPGGDLTDIAVSGQVSVETEANGFPVKVRLEPLIDVRLGADGDLLLEGNALRLDFTAYCHPDRLIAITKGGADYDIPDTSTEIRNPIGYCTGAGSEEILLAYFEFELIDPTLLTGELDLDAMIPVSFEDNGKSGQAGIYEVLGPKGVTRLTITEKDGQIMQIVSSNDDSNLVLDMTYGDRITLTPPTADDRLPSPVSGQVTANQDGWKWEGRAYEGGPLEDYSVTVYPSGSSIGCHGAQSEPVVSFAIKDGVDQQKDGWVFYALDDGNKRLGDGDQLIVRPPGLSQDFDHVVAINDDWAGQLATPGCAMPGLAPGLGVVALLGAVVARRRF